MMAYFLYCRKSGCSLPLFAVFVVFLYFDQIETLKLRGGEKERLFQEVKNNNHHTFSDSKPIDPGTKSPRGGQVQNITSLLYTEGIQMLSTLSNRIDNVTETKHPNDFISDLNTSNTMSTHHNIQLNGPREIVRRIILTLSDQYLPRPLLFKIINFISFYFTRKSSDIIFTLKDKELLTSLVDVLGQKLEEYIAENRVVLSTLFNELEDYPLLERVQRSVVFLSSYLGKENYPKKNVMSVVGRQTPFGVVNIIINFVLNALQDPIVITLLIIFNLWFVFTGIYSVLFGPGYYLLFSTLFGGSGTSSTGSGATTIGVGASQAIGGLASSPQFVGAISDFITEPPTVNSTLPAQTPGSTSSNKIEAQGCVEATQIVTPSEIATPVLTPNPGSVTVVTPKPPLPPSPGQAFPPSPSATHVPAPPTPPAFATDPGTSTATSQAQTPAPPPSPTLPSVPNPTPTSLTAPTPSLAPTFVPTQVPIPSFGTTGISTTGSTQDRFGQFVHFTSLLHTCLSLGGSKRACAAQASLYAQVLKVPITNEILQQSLIVYNTKPPIKSHSKPYYGTYYKPNHSAKPSSPVHLIPPYVKPFVHYQVSKPPRIFPPYSLTNQYREKLPKLKKEDFSKLLTEIDQHAVVKHNFKVKHELRHSKGP